MSNTKEFNAAKMLHDLDEHILEFSNNNGFYIDKHEGAKIVAAHTEALKQQVAEARFLAEQLNDLDLSGMSGNTYADYCGHVSPSLERLNYLLAKHTTKEGGDV